MNILINHCWCSDSIWGGNYNCRVIVSLKRFAALEDVYKRISTKDWDKIIDVIDDLGVNPINKLKPEVIKWLNENIKNRKLSKLDKQERESEKGWAIGSDEYNSSDKISFCLFFERQNDALKFIKHWSIYKNPIDYLNYFKDIRKKLNFKTGKMFFVKNKY